MKKRIQAWTIIGEEFYDAWPTREEAVSWAATNPPEGKWKIVRLVVADPRADAVVRAAVRLRTYFDSNIAANHAELFKAVKSYLGGRRA